MKKNTTLLTLLLSGAMILSAFAIFHQAKAADTTDETYYLPAEVVEILDHTTVFGQVDGPAPSSLTYEKAGIYSSTIPYLLTMDSMGTEDPADDEILVVWGCMSGVS